MQFCSGCGAILNLFEFPERELCTDCFQKQTSKTVEQPLKVKPPKGDCHCTELPKTAQIAYKDGKILITCEEGWILWSGMATQPHQLQMALQSAGRIYKIRSRTKKDIKNHNQ